MNPFYRWARRATLGLFLPNVDALGGRLNAWEIRRPLWQRVPFLPRRWVMLRADAVLAVESRGARACRVYLGASHVTIKAPAWAVFQFLAWPGVAAENRSDPAMVIPNEEELEEMQALARLFAGRRPNVND